MKHQWSIVSATPQLRIPIVAEHRIIQNFCLIWLDAKINDTDDDCRNFISHLRRVANTINTFTDCDTCVDFLTGIRDQKTFMIVSGHLGQHIVPMIHEIPHIVAFYVFCENKPMHEQWAKEWSKVKGVFTDIGPICEALKQTKQQSGDDSIAVSFVSTDVRIDENLNQLDPSFMYTQILKEILLTVEYDEASIKDFTTYHRVQCAHNPRELEHIDLFEREYYSRSAIQWYTAETFLYRSLSRAMRLLDADAIIKMGFFIRDLHQQIEQLYYQQFSNYYDHPLSLYRGQGMSTKDFNKLRTKMGGLISFNMFLTTTMCRDIALIFSESATSCPDLVGVLFVMNIDTTISSTPFANISNLSNFPDEQEVIFSTHTIFRIHGITRIEINDRLWEVNLTLTNDNDPILSALTQRIQAGTYVGSTGWQRLGELLMKLGAYDTAEQIFTMLIDRISDETEKANLYQQIGLVKQNQAAYAEAILFYEKSMELYRNTLPSNALSYATTCNNMGALYDEIGDYSKAIILYEQALNIYQKALPENHPSLATSYNSIGRFYNNIGDYVKAFVYYEKANKTYEKALPPTDPELAQSYNNIGQVYGNMGEYSKALEYYEKSLRIREKALPPTHRELAQSYNNIGLVYDNMGEYSKALEYYDKSLRIREKALPPTHPNLATSYSCIGGVYSNMGEYSTALEYYEKSHKIYEISLPLTHPDLASSYSCIGGLYSSMGEYSKAIEYYQKAFELYEKVQLTDHPDLAHLYKNIGLVYEAMSDYAKALSFYKKALDVRRKAGTANLSEIATSYNNIGKVYNNMGEYSSAVSFYQKALEVNEKTLPSNHPDLATSYDNVGLVYFTMADYQNALSYYKKGVEIRQNALSPDHPDLEKSFNNIGGVYYSMSMYSNALIFYHQALEICKKKLPPNHSDLLTAYNNMAAVYERMDEYSRALRFYEKVAETVKENLSSDHLELALALNNIGGVYHKMGEYSKALSFYERALDKYRSTLPPKHPYLMQCDKNITLLQSQMNE
ncbi:unnamed protein product [Rotaria magnacalcarata]|uniref:UDP-N-acetylglucosamine--peptide N-acetylglucosaminyltransferase SPINDLY n=1 Tax=Rotaria magnacalcarata TaxID=392030 RepID=A0A816CMZ0_9BILA|nr:unnamed protein product [Rotaria magnacalcarata]CAF3818195.1 unnamed protein product [Rotaria magnacalcarata]